MIFNGIGLFICVYYRPYGGSFSSRKVMDARYIILTGSISYQAVQDCLAEFYSSTHCDGNLKYLFLL